MTNKTQKGVLFNIQHYSVHDGEGIRTLIFLKGCPLSCSWCSNPESQSFVPELAYNKDKCLQCGYCIEHNTSNVMAVENDSVIFHPENMQNKDLKLAANCPAKALISYGDIKTVGEIIKLVERDEAFYSRSGGGMTLSGGEPLAQLDFCVALLKEAKKNRIHIAVESCGFVNIKKNMEIFEYIDHLFFDIKHICKEKHKSFTGQSNSIILDNIVNIRKAYPNLHITLRTPIIPDFNDTKEEIAEIANFIKAHIPSAKYELLRFHRFGEPKYLHLNRSYNIDASELSFDLFQSLQQVAIDILGAERVIYI